MLPSATLRGSLFGGIRLPCSFYRGGTSKASSGPPRPSRNSTMPLAIALSVVLWDHPTQTNDRLTGLVEGSAPCPRLPSSAHLMRNSLLECARQR